MAAMQTQKTFGRKAQPQRPPAALRAPAPARQAAPEPAAPIPPPPVIERRDDVDAEIEQWNALRKARKRSFREPWRTLSIVAAIGFGLSSWLLPDSVSNITDLITGGLGVAALVAGFRAPPTALDKSAGAAAAE
jgi:hypothetical protein